MKYPKTKGRKQAAGAEPCRQYAVWAVGGIALIVIAVSLAPVISHFG